MVTAARERLSLGMRPATKAQYLRKWRDFQAFLVATGLPANKVNVDILLAFLEFLTQNHLPHSQLANYVSAIRMYAIILALNTESFSDPRIALYTKAVKINSKFQPVIRPSLDLDILQKIIFQTAKLPHKEVFTPLYLLIFFSFLRLSNVLPHSVAAFDYTRHLTRGDLIFSENNATLIVKWSKTIQDRKQISTLVIPGLGASPLCPIKALKAMIRQIPGEKNDPLFLLKLTTKVSILTDSTARKHLKQISQILHLPRPLTFHAFRRAGAAWAFQNGVPLEHIRHHGLWSSDAIFRYLDSNPSASSPVATAFQRALHS